MSQTVSLCLTNTGNTTLSSTINIYSDYNTGWTLIDSNVPLSSITGSQCPYVLIAPDGTNNIRLIDNVSHCFLDINLKSTASCDTCSFGLKNYSATTVGTISSGILTGTCQANISEYLINWYGPDSTTTIAFSTGSGSTFPHQYNHPFSGVSSIPAQAGTYYPVLENVIISGYSFSNTGGTGEILSLLDCLLPVTVDAYKCDNTTNTTNTYPYSAYNHHIQFSTTSQLSAQPVLVTFQISASTKFIPWSFKGENAPDKIKLSLSGQNYSTLIGLEDIWVGLQVSSNSFNPSSLPNSAITQYFYNKITTLTGLTISDGDKIIIEITPSSVNTNWDFYFTCLQTYNCVDCVTENSVYKILGSTISGTTGSCNTNVISFYLSGCTAQDFKNSDYIKYYVNSYGTSPYIYQYGIPNTVSYTNPYHSFIIPDNTNLIQSPYFGYTQYFTQNSCNSYGRISTNSLCSTSTSPTIYQKSVSIGGNLIISITGNSAVIGSIFNQWDTYKNNTYSGYLFNPNSATTGYYGYFLINYPTSSTPDYCADPSSTTILILHPSSIIQTGITGSDYYLSITSTTIGNGTSFTACDLNCNTNIDNLVNTVNLFSTGSTATPEVLTFTSGFYYQNFILNYNGITSGVTDASSTNRYGYYNLPVFETNTYPFSGSLATLIPSLSASCCSDYNVGGSLSNYFGSQILSKYKYYYLVRLTNPSDVRDFDISANTITNGAITGPYVLAYRYSGGSVAYSDPTYVI